MDRLSGWLTAGAFAALCGTTKETLRHYKDLGLLVPVRRGENGYGYYDAEQFYDFYAIAIFRQTGTPLTEIRRCLQDQSAGGTLVEVPARLEDFQIDFPALEAALNERTKAVLINTPNNPTGAVYSAATIERLAELLQEKSQAYGHRIYLISDEPYREIVYSDTPLPWVPDYYDHTLVCYSYSKSLSLPGQRMGYVLVPQSVEDFPLLYAALGGAGRALGYVCAPSLFQFVAQRCTGVTADLSIYRQNRDTLLTALRGMGYSCAQPEGAFYLFPQTPEPDAGAFCAKARELDLILVPGDSFGCGGHVRISYCVQPELIQRALPKFEKLARMYGLM